MSTPIAAPKAIHFSMLWVAAPIDAPMAIPRAIPIVITIAIHLQILFAYFYPASAPFSTVAVKSEDDPGCWGLAICGVFCFTQVATAHLAGKTFLPSVPMAQAGGIHRLGRSDYLRSTMRTPFRCKATENNSGGCNAVSSEAAVFIWNGRFEQPLGSFPFR